MVPNASEENRAARPLWSKTDLSPAKRIRDQPQSKCLARGVSGGTFSKVTQSTSKYRHSNPNLALVNGGASPEVANSTGSLYRSSLAGG